MFNTLLLVDDEPSILRALERELSNDGYHVFTANSGEEALVLLSQEEVQVIISDQRMPFMTGSELLSQVKKRYPDTIRMVLSGYADFDAVVDAINNGTIYKFLNKPWDSNLLHQTIADAFQLYVSQMSNKQASKALEESFEGTMVTDKDSIMQQINPAFTDITGYTTQDAVGYCLPIFSDDPKNPDKEFIHEALRKTGRWCGEISGAHKNGTTYPACLSITAIYDEQKNIKQYTYLFLDITKQKEAEQKLTQLMYRDETTKLYNRFFFSQQLCAAIEEMQQTHAELAIFYIDIDRFGCISNSLGEKIGDQLLQEVAHRLMAWVGNEHYLARLGNDEFAILLPTISSEDSLKQSAQNLIKKIKQPFLINAHPLYITVSMGIGLYPKHADRYDLLINYANLALSHSKELGGDNCQFYNATMEKQTRAQTILANELQQAFEEQQFLLHYQPVTTFQSGNIVGVEALLRWQHPVHGFIYPDQFLPLCESTGFIIPLGKWVLKTACQQLKKWHDLGYHTLFVAVNLSARQFNDPGLFDVITDVLKSTQIPPACLELEITESLIMHNMEENIKLLTSLRDLGLQLSLDDFGTGYSSLKYLECFPFNILKIDKSFVQNDASKKNRDSLITAIIAMGKSLGLTIIAEGVETPEQLELLKEKQCELMQGYLHSKPLPADKLTEHLATRHMEKWQ